MNIVIINPFYDNFPMARYKYGQIEALVELLMPIQIKQ